MASAPAAVAQTLSFDIRPGRLSDALVALGEQARITVDASDPRLASIPSRAVRGRMPVEAALARLLAGTGYSFRFVAPGAVRIVREPVPLPRLVQPRPKPAPPPAAAEPPAPAPDIIVTASKQGTALARFPGTVHILDLAPEESSRLGARGSEAIVNRLPMLASTSLGPGRNKLYIRGVADSSFNGPSQSIVGQYLGDVRLTFNAPDPSLQLYDIRSVELLEGPQGTLYGTGSLGGILRLVPNEPDPAAFAAAASAGILAVSHGGWGGDISAMLNLPVVRDRLALRVVGYASEEPGYIDDLGRGRRDVNHTQVHGGRAALRLERGGGWTFEVGGVAQYVSGRDGQYATRGLPPLSRRSSVAQPFDNDYLLGQFTLRKRWKDVELMSSTGLVKHVLESQFDATGFPGTRGTQLFTEDVDIVLLSNETRLSRPDARGVGWVAGWSLVRDVNRISRSLGPPAAPLPITGVRNAVTEAALFGQYSRQLTPRLLATLGGRATYSETVGRPTGEGPEVDGPKRSDFRASPTAALTWQAGRHRLAYVRYQQGFRAGGLAIAATGSATTAERFESDSLASLEAGVRVGRRDVDPLSFDVAVSYARWSDIQADLIDIRGLPFTANIGDGRIFGFEAEAALRATPSLRFDAALFLNDSALVSPRPAFAAADERDLPNIATAGARVGAHFETRLNLAMALSVDGSLRYVGKSQLGIGPPIDIQQGGYLDGELGARLDFGRFGLSLDITNVGDVRGNRFSFGNPFAVADRTQVTPLRPRAARIGIDAAF
ncbi:MAG: TonB-dependent receptor domain-containing protein [Allosphingosinicella sp.]